MRLTRQSNTADVRDELIEQDLDNLTHEEIIAVAEDYWDEFKALAARYLRKRWEENHDVWMEADERGYFDNEPDRYE